MLPLPPAARLAGYYFFYFAFIGVFSPYFSLYLQSLNFSAWDIGVLMSQMQLMRLCGPYVWGWLADRGWERLRIIRFAAVTSCLGFASFFWLETLPPMLVAMAILAFFWSAALPLVETLTFDHLYQTPSRYGRIRLWGSIGFIVAVLGTGYLLDSLPSRGVVWLAFLVLCGIIACAFLLPAAPRQHRHAQEVAQDIRQILLRPEVKAFFAACFAMSAAHGALYVFYSIHATNAGYSKGAVGWLWALGVIAEIVVFLLMPKLSLRFGLKKLLLFSFLVACIRFVMIGWLVDNLVFAVFAQLLHGFTFGSYHAAAIAAVNRWFAGSCRGRGQALYSSISFGAGGLLGGLLSGWLWEVWGAAWTYTLSAGFALLGAFLIAQWLQELEDTA